MKKPETAAQELESTFDWVKRVGIEVGSVFLRFLGPLLVIGMNALVVVHLYCFFVVISPLLKDRIGVRFGLLWIAVGLSLYFNLVYNHVMASMIKPGGPLDTRRIEKHRL